MKGRLARPWSILWFERLYFYFAAILLRPLNAASIWLLFRRDARDWFSGRNRSVDREIFQ